MKDYSYLIGRKMYGTRLTILKVWVERRNATCICKCSCGTEETLPIKLKDIKSQHTKSCGCLIVEKATEIQKKNLIRKGINHPSYKHGQTGTYLHKLWDSIKYKCYSESCNRYKNYGGRGITMFEPWIDDYVRFETDVVNEIGHKPFKHLSIDRINNDGNYEPGNIQWNDAKGQALNRDREIYKTIEGRIQNFMMSVPKQFRS